MTREEELIESNKNLQEALKKLTEPPPVRTVSTQDVSSGNVDISEIASGKTRVDMPDFDDPDGTKKTRTLKENEIRRTDARRIGAHIADIASGKMVLVD